MLKAILLSVAVSFIGFASGYYSYRVIHQHQPVAFLAVGACGQYAGSIITDADGEQHPYTVDQMSPEQMLATAKKFGKHANMVNPCPAQETGTTASTESDKGTYL